ncbi:GGDEF domain-containing protein [Pelomonas sp. SE-A7]|uniref:GGDEF domain-containing protein n=1 Tax=Pelomonas sp. SE-A7 TaxID=3054953 RepID=UPI00259C8C14|nr:GGDEF domain-containing protein [Pelomonas sp. SE-A7]MDM4767320.1 GGDEF domain-containing protein [Pelomonas sp. SE-A7]
MPGVLHVDTLLTVYLMVAVLMLGVLVGGAWQARGRYGLWFWTGAFAAVVLAQSARDWAVLEGGPAPLLTLGHIGGVVSAGLVALGVRAFLGLRLHWLALLLAMLVMALLSIVVVSLGQPLGVSLSLSLFGAGLLRAVALWPLVRALRQEFSFPLSLMATDQALSMLAHWLRGWMVMPGPATPAAQTEQANALWLLAFIALLLTQGFALLLLVNQRLTHKILALVEIDPLTGLLNRRGLDDRMLRLHQRAATSQRPLQLAAAMLDLDHFKLINDRHGHAVGDQVLVELGHRLQQQVRASDLAVRLGGEEFVVLWFDVGADSATSMAERLRQSVEQVAFATDAGPLHVGVSIGVASQGAAGEPLEALLKRADAALYEAKRMGRHRVVNAG